MTERMPTPQPSMLHDSSLYHNQADYRHFGPSTYEKSAVYIGCVGCKFAKAFEVPHHVARGCIEIMEQHPDIPRVCVAQKLEGIGQALGCPKDVSTGEADCQHEEALTKIFDTLPSPDHA